MNYSLCKWPSLLKHIYSSCFQINIFILIVLFLFQWRFLSGICFCDNRKTFDDYSSAPLKTKDYISRFNDCPVMFTLPCLSIISICVFLRFFPSFRNIFLLLSNYFNLLTLSSKMLTSFHGTIDCYITMFISRFKIGVHV